VTISEYLLLYVFSFWAKFSQFCGADGFGCIMTSSIAVLSYMHALHNVADGICFDTSVTTLKSCFGPFLVARRLSVSYFEPTNVQNELFPSRLGTQHSLPFKSHAM
jgi:hypothetical protein